MITIASENVRANCSTVPKMAPMRSVYLAEYSGTRSARGCSGAVTAVPSMRMMSRPMSVTSSPNATCGLASMFLSFAFPGWL